MERRGEMVVLAFGDAMVRELVLMLVVDALRTSGDTLRCDFS